MLDQEKAKRNLFSNLKKPAKEELCSSEKLGEDKKCVRVGCFLTEKQKDCLDQIAKEIMRNRSFVPKEKKERITANSVLRCLVEHFSLRKETINTEDVFLEEDLSESLSKIFQPVKR